MIRYLTLLSILLLSSQPCLAQEEVDPTPPEEVEVFDPEAVAATLARPPLPPLDEVLMLRLRHGEIHWGAILGHSADGLRFQRLADGGVADVPWPLLDPRQEAELREMFGYIDVSAEEIYVDAERLVLVDGREITGVILSRDGSQFVIKVDGNLQMIPKVRVASVQRGERLPALDVYTREELYGMFAVELDSSDHESQLELAAKCEQILDFEHAVDHYEAALALLEEAPSELVYALERAQAKAAQQEQVDWLRDADLMRKRGRFDEALEKLDAFAAAFPGSPLTEDSMKARERTLIGRDEEIRELVLRRWDYWSRRVSRSAASELDYSAAVSYAQETLGEEIRERVLADVTDQVTEDINADQIEEFWATRRTRPYKSASYGFGTWLLGDRARAGLEKKAVASTASQTDQARRDLEQKIERFLEAQRAQRRARSARDSEADAEQFWAQYSPGSRSNWIRAYYIEYSGDFELSERPSLRNCPSCAGRGVTEVMAVGGSSEGERTTSVHLVTCSACRGSGILRRIYYR